MTGESYRQRPEVLHGAPLQYAPQNELGVVYLFAHLARKWRLRIENISPSYPDCIAYQKVDGREQRIRIEFEYKSRNFRTHGHAPSRCDWLVCWEHNWPGVPSSLRVVELRREFGLGFNVWIQPVGGPYKKEISKVKRSSLWSVPSRASSGDLLLYYHTRPDKCIKDVFRLTGPVKRTKAGWKKGMDYMGPIALVCRLRGPVFLEDLQNDRILRTASFVRNTMQGRPCATEYWPHLYAMITRRNPLAKRSLARYAPENL